MSRQEPTRSYRPAPPAARGLLRRRSTRSLVTVPRSMAESHPFEPPRAAELRKLRGENELLRLVEESLADRAVIGLDSQGFIVAWSAGATRLLGYAAEEIVGRSYAQLFGAGDLEAELPRRLLTEAVSRGQVEGEASPFGRDGAVRSAQVSLRARHDAGSHAGFALFVCAATAPERSDETLHERCRESAHLARLGAIGQMTAEFVHELQQPLAAAVNYARACLNVGRSGRYELPVEVLTWMERSAEQSLRAIEISQRLAGFAKKGTGERTEVPIERLFRQVLAFARPESYATAPAIAIETVLDESAPCIFADPVQIEQVLLNLLRNALEAMREAPGRNHRLTLRTTAVGPDVAVSVADTGPGIPPERLAKLFEPFFTTKTSGLGLGLSISRSIVENHGGRMTVASSAAGTSFTFTLPQPREGNEYVESPVSFDRR